MTELPGIYCIEVFKFDLESQNIITDTMSFFVSGIENAYNSYETMVKQEREVQLKRNEMITVQLSNVDIGDESGRLHSGQCIEKVNIHYKEKEEDKYFCQSVNRPLQLVFKQEELKVLVPDVININLWDLQDKEVSHVLSYYRIDKEYPEMSKGIHKVLMEIRKVFKNSINLQGYETEYFDVILGKEKLTDETDVLVKTGFKQHTWSEPEEYFYNTRPWNDGYQTSVKISKDLHNLVRDLNDDEIYLTSIVNRRNTLDVIFKLLTSCNSILSEFSRNEGYVEFRNGEFIIVYDSSAFSDGVFEFACYGHPTTFIINPTSSSKFKLNYVAKENTYPVTVVIDADNVMNGFQLRYDYNFPDDVKKLYVQFYDGDIDGIRFMTFIKNIPPIVDKMLVNDMIDSMLNVK